MENQKLEVILEILEDIDEAKARNEFIDKMDSLELINQRCSRIMAHYTKNDTYRKILEFLGTECCIEMEKASIEEK